MQKLTLRSGPAQSAGSPPKNGAGTGNKAASDEEDSWDVQSETEGNANYGHQDFVSEDDEQSGAALSSQGSDMDLGAIALASMLTDDAIACTKDQLIGVLRQVPNAKASRLAVIARMLGFIEASMVATPAKLRKALEH